MPVLLLLACVRGPVSQTGYDPIAEPAPAPAGALAPHVHTVEQLRASMPVGTVIRLRVRAAGAPEVEQRWEVTAADALGVTIASRVLGADGALLKDEGASTSTWAELYSHADFPADRTLVGPSSVDVPAGHFETVLYTVIGTPEEGGRDFVKQLHFAKDLPGPPVYFTIVDGKGTTLEMTLLERTPR